jgi:dihydroorotate dehydrogenase electron transfer subunit
MTHFSARVLANCKVADDYYELRFEWHGLEEPRPGQFLTLRASSGYDPLLRRPFAFSAFGEESSGRFASVLYQPRGKGTAILCAKAEGEVLDLLGPLGKPFPTPSGRPVLVAGGIGLGPILFLHRSLHDSGAGPILAFGARSGGMVPKALMPEGALVCTDDGSMGERCYPHEAVARMLEGAAGFEHFACGPKPLLAAMKALADKRGERLWVSLEQTIACGVGACMGCAVKLAEGGYARVCAEGPVFDARDVAWN